MSRTLRRPAAVAVPATILATALAAPAVAGTPSVGKIVPVELAGTVSHWATFQGEVDRSGRSGVAGDNVGTPSIENGTCTDTGSGLTNTSCSVAWNIDRSICTVEPGALLSGYGSYTSSTNESVVMPLFGAGEAGSGVVEGRFTLLIDGRPMIAHMVIDAGDYCGALLLATSVTGSELPLASGVRGGSFSGHVDLAAV